MRYFEQLLVAKYPFFLAHPVLSRTHVNIVTNILL